MFSNFGLCNVAKIQNFFILGHSSLNDDVFANSNGGSASISITTNGVSNDQDLMSR